MSITRRQVEHVVHLSRLAVSDEELDRLTRDLADILRYVEKINELDTADVPPMAHALTEENVLREDACRPCLTPDEALENAPAQARGCFKVPRIIE
jgi:aspartyl-tRNA(Asn)/glutamyl-tRNA(Gln) amidotransferase subunit C